MSESRQNTMPLYDYHCPACDNHFELLAGGKYFHYKTSPQGEQYIKGTIYGPTVSLRYYFKKQ